MMRFLRKAAKEYFPQNQNAQATIEYLLILAVVAAIVFLGLQTWLTQIHDTSENYFNEVSEGVVGPPPPASLN